MLSKEAEIFTRKGMIGWLRWRESFGKVKDIPMKKVSKKDNDSKEFYSYEPFVDKTIQILSMMVLHIIKEEQWM